MFTRLFTIMLFVVALCGAGVPSRAQTQPPATGSVAGRVTLEGKVAQGVHVVLLRDSGAMAAQATTDAEGRYTVANVPPARYRVLPQSPAYVIETEEAANRRGRVINVAAGESVSGIDFALVRGGVITGQVTDAEGQPVIAERVALLRGADDGSWRAAEVANPLMFETDDRGVYRLYGLPAGRYKVSAGQGGEAGIVRASGRRAVYARTFHPNTPDEAGAEIVELTTGGEATGIDIQIGQTERTFTATGRIIDAQTAQPVSDASFSYAATRRDGRHTIAHGQRASATGEFRLNNLTPGHYVVFVNSEGLGDSYSDPVAFDVLDADVSGLELRLRRGASVSGVVVVEGANSPALSMQLAQVPVGAFLFQPELNSPGMLQSRINADGTFHIGGLRPGKLRIASNSNRAPRGFILLRVERGGVEQRDAIDLAPGEQVKNVRVVVAYGSGIVRGRVNVTGGALPAGTRLAIVLRRAGTYQATGSVTASVDARGAFVVEGVAAGNYELMLGALPTPTPGGVSTPRVPVVRRAVTVADGAATELTLTLDLSAGQSRTEQSQTDQ